MQFSEADDQEDPTTMKNQTTLVFFLAVACSTVGKVVAFGSAANILAVMSKSSSMTETRMAADPVWFGGSTVTSTATSRDEVNELSLGQLKAQILQLGAALDRGQAYNPTSGSYYEASMEIAKDRIKALVANHPKPAMSISDMEGEWELVLTTGASRRNYNIYFTNCSSL